MEKREQKRTKKAENGEKALVEKDSMAKLSYRKKRIIDPNWMICDDGYLPQGPKSHCIVNIVTIIHTLF